MLGVRVFGELEFWFSSIKVITLIGLLLMGIIIDLGGNPRHDRIGFRYWQNPDGPMGHYLLSTVHEESLSIFLGFWSTLTNALFAYIGTELIGVTVGEAQAPRKNIPIAIRRTFFRILIFYVGGVFVIGLIVPSTNQVGRERPCSLRLTANVCFCSRSSSRTSPRPVRPRPPSLSVSAAGSRTRT